MSDTLAPADEAAEANASAETPLIPPPSWRTEDWWAIWLGSVILVASLAATWLARPADQPERVARFNELTRQLDAVAASPDATVDTKKLRKERKELLDKLAVNPLQPYVSSLGGWSNDPTKALVDKKGKSVVPGVLGVYAVLLVLFTVGMIGLGERWQGFPLAFTFVFLLAALSYVLAGQEVVSNYGLEYALWAILMGLVLSNTVGTPAFVRPALRTEFFIKTGLVLLGAGILFDQLLALGVPGIFVSWVVTPITLITTYLFGQYVLGIKSRSLNMVISADMSVCGVSAAIATAAACRAKREELSLAIALSLGFTVVMMIVMPMVIRATGMSPVLGGAWIGGTIDSTGAVAAAGGMVDETAKVVAMTVKMIQNILIGVIAFGVSIYWVGWVERTPGAPRVGVGEVWKRFPKFMLGFVGASLAFSFLSGSGPEGQATAAAVISGTVKTLHGWLFCLGFVCIGLETNFKELAPYFKGGKPLVLYVCGQALNLALTLFMAWLMFEKVFPHAADSLTK